MLVAVVVVGGLWWAYSQPRVMAPSLTEEGGLPQNTAQNGGAVPSASGDTTDAALDQDLSAADMQLNALNADSASIDSGLNDTPVTQGQ